MIYIDNDVDIATDVNDENDFSGKPSDDTITITDPRAMNTSKIYFDVFRCTISSSSLFA